MKMTKVWHVINGSVVLAYRIVRNFALFADKLRFVKIFPVNIMLYYMALCLHIEGEIIRKLRKFEF